MELHPTDIHVLPSFHPHISRRFPLPLPVARKSYQPRSECLNTHPRKNGLFSFQGIFILEPSWKVFLVGISTTDSLLTAAICASSAKLPTLLKGIWGNLERSNGGNRTWHSARWGERAWDWLRPPPPRVHQGVCCLLWQGVALQDLIHSPTHPLMAKERSFSKWRCWEMNAEPSAHKAGALPQSHNLGGLWFPSSYLLPRVIVQQIQYLIYIVYFVISFLLKERNGMYTMYCRYQRELTDNSIDLDFLLGILSPEPL